MTPFVKCWSDGGVPQDTRDARIVTLNYGQLADGSTRQRKLADV